MLVVSFVLDVYFIVRVWIELLLKLRLIVIVILLFYVEIIYVVIVDIFGKICQVGFVNFMDYFVVIL